MQIDDIEKRLKKDADSFYRINGYPDHSIIIGVDDFNSRISVFENKRKLFMMGAMYDFADIISCEISDNSTPPKSSYTTETKTGSVIGRAVVGSLFAGAAGAIIGGATAKRTTTEDDRGSYLHDYVVTIGVNSFINPTIKIRVKNDLHKANEIQSIIQVIIMRNQRESYSKAREAYVEPLSESEHHYGKKQKVIGRYDPQLGAVARFIVVNQKCSPSSICRRFDFTTGRCIRLMDQLEEMGIIGSEDANKTRPVLVPDEVLLDRIMDEYGVEI